MFKANNDTFVTLLERPKLSADLQEYYELISEYYFNPECISDQRLQHKALTLETDCVEEFRRLIETKTLTLPGAIAFFIEKLNIKRNYIYKNAYLQELFRNFFDKLLNITTPESYRHSETTLFNDGLLYIPTPFTDQLAILNYLPKLFTPNTNLVDWGAGAGNFAFKIVCSYPINVTLVEFEKELIAHAQKNDRELLLRQGRTKIIQGDAALVKVSDATIHYLYKPFKRQTFWAWLENIEKDLAYQKKSYIIYMPAIMADENQNYLDNTPWLKYLEQIPGSSAQVWQIKG